jgi:ORF6N domain
MAKGKSIIPIERIASRIYLIRGEKVMLDSDLAELYGVKTKALVQAVKRNSERFPDDFMFQLSQEELENWRSQIVTSNPAAKMGLRRRPYAFTEQGVAMLSSVLRSKRAAEMNVLIIRVFVKMREMLASNAELARRVEHLDRRVSALYEAFQRHFAPQDPSKKNPIGYVPPKD